MTEPAQPTPVASGDRRGAPFETTREKGTPAMSEPRDDEQAFLDAYDPRDWPPVAVGVDIVMLAIRDGNLSVLLVQRAQHPHRGRWALPGGFVGPDEALDDAAARELREEAGPAVAAAAHLEQLASYGDPDRDPRMRVVSVAYLALTRDAPAPSAGSDAHAARWWVVDDLDDEQVTLAFDHRRILDDGIERARAKLEYTTLATSLVDHPFTISELRRVYEAVWGVELEPANFRRKVLSTGGFVTPVGDQRNAVGRPAALYTAGGAVQMNPPMTRP